MHQRPSQYRFCAALLLAAMVAACGGAATGRLADFGAGGAGPTASPESSPVGAPRQATQPPALVSAPPTPRPTATQAISTTEASELLRQVDDLLRQSDGDLSADADAAITMGE